MSAAKPQYPRSPRNVNRETWFYEEPSGLVIVRQLHSPRGELVHADIFTVPWRFVERAVANHRRIKTLRKLRRPA